MTVTTALERAVEAGEEPAKATPLDALKAARRMWLKEQRIDMGALATGLRVSRATLYNWVGDRELLLGEVLWSLAADNLRQSTAAAQGSGAAYLADVNARYLGTLAEFAPTRRFIERDPELALRVLTSRRTTFQQRLVAAQQQMIEDQMRDASYVPPLDPATLAYVLVRIGESFIFADFITGSEPDLDKAIQASRVLLHAPPVPV